MRHAFSHLTNNDIDFGILEQQQDAVLAGFSEAKLHLKNSSQQTTKSRKFRVQTSLPQRRAYSSHCWKCATSISSQTCSRCSRCKLFLCSNCKQCLCPKVNVVVFPRVAAAKNI
jgi:hypothetical protein